MRLTDRQRQQIREAVTTHIPGAVTFLFGSRLDDSKRGGDIDLLVLTPEKVTREIEVRIIRALERELGAQRIDLLVRPAHEPGHFASAMLYRAEAV